MSETATTTESQQTALQKGFVGQSIPRKEDRRLVQGQGQFVDDIRRHGMGYVHFVRAPYAHAKIVSIDVSAALELDGVYGTITGDEVAIQTDPFFEMSVAPGNQIQDYALAVGRVRHQGEPVAAVCAATRELARDAAELVEVEYEPLPVLVDAEESLKDEVLLHEEAGTNVVWSGVFDWGDWEQAKAEADHVVTIKKLHFHRFSSTPLECSGALVEYDKGMLEWTIHCNHQMPGVGAIWMAPALRTGIDKLRFVTGDIGGGFGNKICLHPQFVVLCLLARKLGRPVQWTEWRTDQHMANAHGNERTFLDVEVAVKADGTLTGFNVKALDDCGAFPRYEPLGCIIWAQVTPGCYEWKNIRVDFTQVCTNKSPVSPNRGYSRMQHLWLTERIIDIVAAELDFDPVEIRKRNYVKEFPYETPNGCFYDSGDYAGCLDIALDLIGYEGIEARREEARSRGKLLGLGIGSTLDSGTNNFGQSQLLNPELQFSGNNEAASAKLDIFGEVVVTLGTVPQGQGHETTSAQVVADIIGCSTDQVNVRRGHDTWFNTHAGFSGTYASQFAVTGLGAVKGAAELLRDEMIKLAVVRPAGARGGDRALRRLRPHQGRPARGGAAVHGAGRHRQREQRVPAAGLQPDSEPPLRLPAVLRAGRPREEDGPADAHVRDADPRLRGRDRPGDGSRRDRRLRRRRRLRHAHPPADRRGAGARRHRPRDRCRHPRGLRLRRGRDAADAQLLRLPRAARARHPAAPHRRDRVAVPGDAARRQGHGRGRRRRHPLHLLGHPGRIATRRTPDRVRLLQSVPPDLGDAPGPGVNTSERRGGHQVNVSGTKEFDAHRATVWSVLNDPAQMAQLMPGVESFEIKDDRHWQAKVKIPLGLGGLKMTIEFEKLEEREPEFASLNAKGNGVGALMNMTTRFTLNEDGDKTSMDWAADVKIAGPVGSMGQRVLQPIVNQQVANVLTALEAQVQKAKAASGA